MEKYKMLYKLETHGTFRTTPKGMTKMKKLSDGTIIDSNGRKYIKAEDGSLRRIK